MLHIRKVRRVIHPLVLDMNKVSSLYSSRSFGVFIKLERINAGVNLCPVPETQQTAVVFVLFGIVGVIGARPFAVRTRNLFSERTDDSSMLRIR
jgi:hypothetical protein